MQRKAKEQEERALEQEHIHEGLNELNRQEKENFARYDFVFFIIIYYLNKTATKKGDLEHRGPCAVILALLTLFDIHTVMCYVVFLPTTDCVCDGSPMRL